MARKLQIPPATPCTGDPGTFTITYTGVFHGHHRCLDRPTDGHRCHVNFDRLRCG
jgi:hypothetical protein